MAEASYRENSAEVKKVYERMRCGTLGSPQGSSDRLVLPPLSVFCTLPSVRVLKGSPDPNRLLPDSASVASDINSSLAISLITSDLRAWLIPVEKHLMTLLGYPSGWQSASARTLPPLKRVTARFFCRECGEGGVGKRYERERCLDFKGVCSHVCVGTRGKNIEGRESEIGNGQEKGGKKGGAISVVKAILDLLGLSEEGPNTAVEMNSVGGVIRCVTCKGWIVMDADTAARRSPDWRIGHAHRHESMEIELMRVPRGSMAPNTRLGFERGTSELLLGPSYRAQTLRKKVNYGCRHCLDVEEDLVNGIKEPKNRGARAMDFNALRSHVKEK
ncbi:hypothetical protein HD554DRAFT_2019528 [Boletus coccyginus]|nr:hypothetical protein HD554DRAFT_2019528 [Boletus coccyginus]